MDPGRLEGTILVTGGTGALGQAVVAQLLEAGARVVSTWVVDAERERAQQAFSSHTTFELVRADLSSDEGPREAVRAATAGNPPFGGLVNLVGGYAGSGRFHEASPEELEQQLELNLMTGARMMRAALPHMVAQGGGSIVCVGTRAALEPFSGASGYIVGKAALLALVRTLAVEYRGDDVRVNAVIPSVIDTPANRAAMPDADHSKWVEPLQIARVIRFLCSPESAITSGALIPVYGRA